MVEGKKKEGKKVEAKKAGVKKKRAKKVEEQKVEEQKVVEEVVEIVEQEVPVEDTPKVDTPKVDTPKEEVPTKAVKREESWAELIAKIPREFTPRIGGKWSGKLDEPLISVAMATRETLTIPGYGPDKASFKQVFGVGWNAAEKTLQEAYREKRGRVVTVSVGANHYLIIIPVKDVELVDRDGKKFTMKRKDSLKHMQGGTNHGRIYKKARHIAQEYGLSHIGIPPGQYTRSNIDNFNFTKNHEGKWQVYTTQKNSTKVVPFTPEEFIEDLIGEGELQKVING